MSLECILLILVLYMRTSLRISIKCHFLLYLVDQEAEEMHLKAIEIKERLLGSDDYEVALSVGHLASLYNYDMEKFDEAEKLYLRSISIGKCVLEY